MSVSSRLLLVVAASLLGESHQLAIVGTTNLGRPALRCPTAKSVSSLSSSSSSSSFSSFSSPPSTSPFILCSSTSPSPTRATLPSHTFTSLPPFSQRSSSLLLSSSNGDDTDNNNNDPTTNFAPVDSPSSPSSASSVSLSDTPPSGSYITALKQTALTVLLSCLFAASVGFFKGPNSAIEFAAGYLVEQSLSVDNLFVFILLFKYFKVPLEHQPKILNYGIIGAIGMRAIMIGAGAIALQKFHSILLVFAGILVLSSGKILAEFFGVGDEEEADLSENAIIKFTQKLFKTTDETDGDKFFIDGAATSLFLCLVAIELSDVVFAVDSVPAVFGVTEDPLIVFSSNLFAISGLRSLFTVLSSAVTDLKFLEPAVAVVLGFIGSKMIFEVGGVCIPTIVSLVIVLVVLSLGVGASYAFPDEEEIVAVAGGAGSIDEAIGDVNGEER